MAVSAVETYLNVLARLWLDQNPEFEHRERIEHDLRTKKSLTRKLEEWPALLFGKSLSLGSGPRQIFRQFIERRNQLMHFSSESHTLEVENVRVSGLIDTTAYERLTSSDAKRAASSAEDFIEYLLQVQGIAKEQVPHALHHWVGRPPERAT